MIKVENSHWVLRALGLALLMLAVAGLSRGEDKIDVERVKALYEKSKRGDKLTPDEQKYLDRALQELKKNPPSKTGPSIDLERAKRLYEKSKREKLTPEEQDYLDRARKQAGRAGEKAPKETGEAPKWKEQPSTGMIPLVDMSASAQYKEQDGGLYGGGQNAPPKEHQLAADKATGEIRPLDAAGKPAADGKIVLISLGMSNTAGEFMIFKEIADAGPNKSPSVVLVNCAIGGAGVRSWTHPTSGTWEQVAKRLKDANITPEQVQVAWIKHAEAMPDEDKVPLQYAKQVRDDIGKTISITKAKFPNLKVAYLSSRIYGGYNAVGRRRVNPEPFAYETAFSVRWVIQDQIQGKAHNYDAKRGQVVAPVLLWGPYLWADGIKPRKSDGLTWKREDFSNDGVHPTRDKGGRKVADQLLNFFKNDANTRTWFVKK
jgi:hypothetical protein